MESLLSRYKQELPWQIIPLPAKMDVVRVQLHPVGLLKELCDRITIISVGYGMRLPFECLTSSNVSTMHSYCKSKGFKLHCIRDGNFRILWTEARDGYTKDRTSNSGLQEAPGQVSDSASVGVAGEGRGPERTGHHREVVQEHSNPPV